MFVSEGERALICPILFCHVPTDLQVHAFVAYTQM